jgi:hypothetical protein
MITANIQVAISGSSTELEVSVRSSAVHSDKHSAEPALIRGVREGNLNAFYELVRPYKEVQSSTTRKTNLDVYADWQEYFRKQQPHADHVGKTMEFLRWRCLDSL